MTAPLVKITYTNIGKFNVAVFAGLCVDTACVNTLLTQAYTAGNELLVNAKSTISTNSCDRLHSSTSNIVGAVAYAPTASVGHLPLAWYFYDFDAENVYSQQDHPLINMTGDPQVEPSGTSILGLTIDPKPPVTLPLPLPLDPSTPISPPGSPPGSPGSPPKSPSIWSKYWWLILLVLLTIGIVVVVLVRRRAKKM